MKRFWVFLLSIVCFVFMTICTQTRAYASMSEDAEDYELGEIYTGSQKGTGDVYGVKYYKFTISEKSHVSFSYSNDRNSDNNSLTDLSVYDANGKNVVPESDFIMERDFVNAKWKCQQYRVLNSGVYFFVIKSWDYCNYEFTINAESQIKLGKGNITDLNYLGSGKIKIDYQSVQDAIGYCIQYSTKDNFKSGLKTVRTGDLSMTISGLKKGKRYYVRVAPYTVYSDGIYVCGQYSLPKSVRVK